MDIVPRPFSFCKGKRHHVKHPPLQQNPPELENLPLAGPRSKYPAARGRGGSESLTPFLCSTLFAFFMCAVSHTLARQHRRCAALFYSGDSLRFPAYNGNEMPPSIRTPRGIQTTMLAALFYVGTFAAVCARGRGMISPQCPGTPRVKPHEKSRLFSDRGAESFLWSAFLSGNSFFRAGFCGVAWAWKGLSPVVVFHLAQGGKAASPASASPWCTPANRCRTRLFSAPNSPAFRGSQQPLRAFPLEEPSADQEPLALLSTSRSSTLPCSKYQENHPVP